MPDLPMKTTLKRINIENAIKLVALIIVLGYLSMELRPALLIMFKNNPEKAGDVLLAVSTLVVGAMFAYFSHSYAVVKADQWIFRLLVYIKTFLLLFSIILTLKMSAILFPIFLGGLDWLFGLLTYALMAACLIYDIINIQVIGKDHR